MKNKKIILLILFFILILGGFLRFYRIDEYMTFLGDEGRDVLVVKRILVDHKFTLLGPITSVGSMYMGPIYYYFMAPFLWLWHFDPLGPAVMVALFSIATIGLIYLVCADFFNPYIGLISAFFYAIAKLPIIHGRSSWNPNLVPFFSLLIIYSLLKIIIHKKPFWVIILGLVLGIIIQLHYVTVMFIPIIFLCYLLNRSLFSNRTKLLGILSFILGYSPFLLFELRHQFVNFRAVLGFLGQQQHESGLKILSILSLINDVFVRLFWRLLVVENAEFTKIIMVIVFISLGYFWSREANEREKSALKIILIWLILGVMSFGIYRGVIYDYYFGSLFTLPFILAGIALFFLWKQKVKGKLIAITIFLLITIFNFRNSPFKIEPNNLLKNTRTIARFVFDKAEGKPYNFALIAGKNSDHAYRYFFEIWGNPPVTIGNPQVDPERKTVTEQLLVICEEKICQPLGHPLWEISGFGRAEITDTWQVSTAKVFRLVRYLGKE